MKKLIGTCGKVERRKVWWFEGDRIEIEGLNVTFCSDTRDREEALAICRRNLLKFEEV